jgi:elongation factor P
MVLVTEIKPGITLKIEERLYKVLEIFRHAGSGQMHGFVELKLKDMHFGNFSERRFKMTDKLEEVELTKRQMEYIYTTGDEFYFMDCETYEQVPVNKNAIGTSEKFLKEGSKVTIELLGEQPIAIQFPKVIEIKVTSTGPGIREAQDNTMKPATLENGIDILVPHFVATGDTVRIDTEKLKYIDRVTIKKV